MADLPTVTITFLFTDIEGSTKLWQEHPTAMPEALTRHHSILNECIAAHGGYVFQIIGDAFCAAFSIAINGLCAALSAQRALCDEPWGDTGPIRVRMALHTGAAQVREGELKSGEYVSSLTLSRAARLLSAGYGGQVLVSSATAELVRDDLPESAHLSDLGAHRLKDLFRPERIYQVVIPDLASEFPPLKTLDTHPNNLPIQLTSFVGREQEMKRVKQLLDNTRLLTLTGAGGSGKSRLAVQVAADLTDEFPDGVWLVELAPLSDPALIPQAAASVFGLREEPGRPAMMALTDCFHAKTALLLLDNCEHLLDATARFADSLLHSAPHVKAVTTSREALGIAGETAYRVPSLSMPSLSTPVSDVQSLTQYEAVQLLIDRALAVYPEFHVTNQNAPAVAQICHRLDGIPLAIELAAARVRVLSVEQIAAHLDDRFRLLTGGSRTALPRHQTLRAAIDWSYGLLAQEERILLCRLSVFAGGWTLEAAQAVCGCDPVCADDVLDLLARLVDKSLVMVEPSGSEVRYRIIETVRQYGRDRLLESGEGELVRNRHLDFFLELAKRAEPELHSARQLVWLDRLDLEHDNMRVALDWSLGHGRCEKGLDLLRALRAYWVYREYKAEGREWADKFLCHPEARGKQNLAYVNALLVGGILSSGLDEEVNARRYYEELVVVARELGESARGPYAWGVGALSFIAFGEDPLKGLSMVEEGLNVARATNDNWIIATLLAFRGRLFLANRDYTAARQSYEEALAIRRSMGDRELEFGSVRALASLAFRQLDCVAARRYLESSLLLARQVRSRSGIQGAVIALGEIERFEGNYAEAKKHYKESLAIARDVGRRLQISMSLGNLGHIALAEGDSKQARSLFTESLEFAQKHKHQPAVVSSLMGFGGVFAAQQKAYQATRLLAVYQTFLESGDTRTITPADDKAYESYLALARSQLDDGTFSAAWAEGQKMTVEEAVGYAQELLADSRNTA